MCLDKVIYILMAMLMAMVRKPDSEIRIAFDAEHRVHETVGRFKCTDLNEYPKFMPIVQSCRLISTIKKGRADDKAPRHVRPSEWEP